MVLLTKSDILNGKADRQDVYIELLDKEISLRPLTDGEFNKVLAMSKDLGPVKADINESNELSDPDSLVEKGRTMTMNMDLKKTEEAKFRADCLCASFGLSNDKETFLPSDLQDMRPIGVVAEISAAVIRISKLDEPETLEEDVKDFRE